MFGGGDGDNVSAGNDTTQVDSQNPVSPPQKSFSDLLRAWEEQHNSPGFNPTDIFHQMCDILEKETRVYVASDPDPFEVLNSLLFEL